MNITKNRKMNPKKFSKIYQKWMENTGEKINLRIERKILEERIEESRSKRAENGVFMDIYQYESSGHRWDDIDDLMLDDQRVMSQKKIEKFTHRSQQKLKKKEEKLKKKRVEKLTKREENFKKSCTFTPRISSKSKFQGG